MKKTMNLPNPIFLLTLAILAWIASLWILPTHAGETLSLSTYLEQVESGNLNLKSAREASEGASLRSSESTLLYSPQLLIEGQWSNDHRLNPMFSTAYRKVRNDSYTLGIEQLTPIGVKGGIYYNLLREHYIGSSNDNVFFEGRPRIELSVSLLRNALGSETRAQSSIVESGARAAQYSESFKAKMTRADAESAYIQLAAARELKKMDQASFDRAQDILSWASNRFKMNLGENSDLLQAQANLEAKRLQLQASTDRERTASRTFNRLREKDGDEVNETIQLPEGAQLEVPARSQVRDDVKAAQEGSKVSAAQATLGRERNKPALEIYGSYGKNSRNGEWNKAFSDGFSEDRPTSAWGIRFQTPILIGSQMDAVKGYGLEKTAADRLVDQKLFEQEIEWKELTQRFDEAKKRYVIAEKLSTLQKKKVENERAQLKRGRTTTYQSLLFEQDYIEAEALRVQAQSEVLEILARLKTFGGA